MARSRRAPPPPASQHVRCDAMPAAARRRRRQPASSSHAASNHQPQHPFRNKRRSPAPPEPASLRQSPPEPTRPREFPQVPALPDKPTREPVDANVVAAHLGGSWRVRGHIRGEDFDGIRDAPDYNITISPINGTWGTWLLGVRISWMTEAGEDSLEQTLQCVTGGVTVQGGEGEWEGMRATLELGLAATPRLRPLALRCAGATRASKKKSQAKNKGPLLLACEAELPGLGH